MLTKRVRLFSFIFYTKATLGSVYICVCVRVFVCVCVCERERERERELSNCNNSATHKTPHYSTNYTPISTHHPSPRLRLSHVINTLPNRLCRSCPAALSLVNSRAHNKPRLPIGHR